MKFQKKSVFVAVAMVSALSSMPFSQAMSAGHEMSAIEKGKAIAFSRKKGNCLTCHNISGGTVMGNIAPPLVVMKARFPDKAKLRAQIWDATASNPHTTMPPFGKYKIISEKEIDLVTEYIHSL